MAKALFVRGTACSALAWALLTAGTAHAQIGGDPTAIQSAPATNDTAAPDIVVTGTLIRGTPENLAVPVDVISSEELAKQGAPTAVDLLKNLTVANGTVGDANQFDTRAQGSEGVASVNLRGLGPSVPWCSSTASAWCHPGSASRSLTSTCSRPPRSAASKS